MGYIPLTPYIDDESTLANNLLCPRYAENDATSAPPSPASIESFDILDSVAWRQGHFWHHSRDAKARACGALGSRWQKNRSQIICAILLLLLLVAGCVVGSTIAWRYQNTKLREDCTRREGGKRCEEISWAKCVAMNGVGYCEGALGTGKDAGKDAVKE